MSDWIYFYTSKKRIKWSIESYSIDHLEKSWGRGVCFFKSPLPPFKGESHRLLLNHWSKELKTLFYFNPKQS
jgi:hypothetical protein